MRVIKNNYEDKKTEVKRIEDFPRLHTCEDCGSELEYYRSDLNIGALGMPYLTCPCCGYENMIDDKECSITITENNIDFPRHFFHICKENGAVDCCTDENVRQYIKQAINFFRNNKDEFVWYASTGNINITVYRNSEDKDYWVIVTNNYYETYISFEEEDY